MAQIMPRNAQARLFFPHLADGGTPDGQWQTRFTFINPNNSPASVAMSLFADDGGPLGLDFGGGPSTTGTVAFTIPANGTVVFRSRMASSVTVTGWAYATSSLPIQGNVAFRLIENGTAKVEITAEPTLPSAGYRSVATPLVGVAVANIYGSPLPVTVTVYDHSELISDSPSELAFIVAHELGHIYQQRTGKFIWDADREWDADHWGLLMSLAAGYDPYAGAGILGKLGMATGTANLGTQLWEDSVFAADAHGSFSTRIDNLTQFIQQVCGYSADTQNSCSQYKSGVHPHFPSLPTVPLRNPGVTK